MNKKNRYTTTSFPHKSFLFCCACVRCACVKALFFLQKHANTSDLYQCLMRLVLIFDFQGTVLFWTPKSFKKNMCLVFMKLAKLIYSFHILVYMYMFIFLLVLFHFAFIYSYFNFLDRSIYVTMDHKISHNGQLKKLKLYIS